MERIVREFLVANAFGSFQRDDPEDAFVGWVRGGGEGRRVAFSKSLAKVLLAMNGRPPARIAAVLVRVAEDGPADVWAHCVDRLLQRHGSGVVRAFLLETVLGDGGVWTRRVPDDVAATMDRVARARDTTVAEWVLVVRVRAALGRVGDGETYAAALVDGMVAVVAHDVHRVGQVVAVLAQHVFSAAPLAVTDRLEALYTRYPVAVACIGVQMAVDGLVSARADMRMPAWLLGAGEQSAQRAFAQCGAALCRAIAAVPVVSTEEILANALLPALGPVDAEALERVGDHVDELVRRIVHVPPDVRWLLLHTLVILFHARPETCLAAWPALLARLPVTGPVALALAVATAPAHVRARLDARVFIRMVKHTCPAATRPRALLLASVGARRENAT